MGAFPVVTVARGREAAANMAGRARERREHRTVHCRRKERRVPLSCPPEDGFLEVELAPMTERASERKNERTNE